MFIQTEETPNPLAMKFITNSEIVQKNYNVSYSKSGNLQDIPKFVKDLFQIQSIANIMVNGEFITISIEDDANWGLVKPEVIHILLDYSQNGGLKVEKKIEKEAKKEFEGIEKEIAELIDERVRPAVEMDGGDIEFIRFDEGEGIVYVKMKGSCDGCPSSSATLKNGIKRMLEYYVPEVIDVVPVIDE